MQPALGLLLTGADVVSTLIFLVAVMIPGGAAVAKRPEDGLTRWPRLEAIQSRGRYCAGGDAFP